MRPLYIAVCGGGGDGADVAAAERIGRVLAEGGAVVVTGGLGGVMEAASRGAREAGGVVLAILSGDRHDDANLYASVVVPTGLGEARNALVVRAADALIAVGGEFGTLSEIALALRTGVPVVSLDSWELSRPGVIVPIEHAATPDEAARRALDAAAERRATRGR